MKKIVLLFFLFITSSYVHAQQRPAVKKAYTIPRQKLISKAVKEDYLIVVDNMIFDNDDAAFAKVPKDSLLLINTIRDTLTTSNIKTIRIYKKK